MRLDIVPSLCREALCITGDPLIGAVVSSYFNSEQEYFILLEPPRMERPDYTNEIIRRNNVIAKLQPKFIILAGLEDNSLNECKKLSHPSQILIIDSLEDVDHELKKIRHFYFTQNIYCSKSDLPLGLLIAKTLKGKLCIDEKATPITTLFSKYLSKLSHCIILDDLNAYSPVIAANYSFSLKASLKFFPQMNRDRVEHVYDALLDRVEFSNLPRGQKAQSELSKIEIDLEKLEIQLKDAEFVTYITVGLPYGYFYPEIPSTHLFSRPDLGLCIFSAIYHKLNVRTTRSAILLDPGHFEKSETDFMFQELTDGGVYTILLSGREAKSNLVRNFIEHFPYDLLFICSHGGEIPGKRLTIEFDDSKGESHTIVIDHATGFSLTGRGEGEKAEVEVVTFIGFVELDGIDCRTKRSNEKNTGNIISDFTKIKSKDWCIIESLDIPYVKNCNAIKLSDGVCLMGFHSIGGYESPIVFNNCCFSFYGWGLACLFGGARSYIGTLTPVANETAKNLAEKLFSKLSNGKPLAMLLWEIQKEIIPNFNERVYIHLGCHFNNIDIANKNMIEDIRHLLDIYKERWTTKTAATDDVELKMNSSRVLEFLSSIKI